MAYEERETYLNILPSMAQRIHEGFDWSAYRHSFVVNDAQQLNSDISADLRFWEESNGRRRLNQ